MIKFHNLAPRASDHPKHGERMPAYIEKARHPGNMTGQMELTTGGFQEGTNPLPDQSQSH